MIELPLSTRHVVWLLGRSLPGVLITATRGGSLECSRLQREAQLATVEIGFFAAGGLAYQVRHFTMCMRGSVLSMLPISSKAEHKSQLEKRVKHF
jgi:hypothetical protein